MLSGKRSYVMQTTRRDTRAWIKDWARAKANTECAGTGASWRSGRTAILLVTNTKLGWRRSKEGSRLTDSSTALMGASHGKEYRTKMQRSDERGFVHISAFIQENLHMVVMRFRCQHMPNVFLRKASDRQGVEYNKYIVIDTSPFIHSFTLHHHTQSSTTSPPPHPLLPGSRYTPVPLRQPHHTHPLPT